ncbi:MAG TPA: lipid II flippase MurJ [Micromonosporaceae bacterium]|nr:lipid II flippase MurJ [Micromonosporaceae bacterium]
MAEADADGTPVTDDSSASAVARNSMSMAVWTLVSRVTGFGRIAVTGAVLGPTFLGNTFQAVNSLPNMIVYQLLLGSLFVSLLVPSLVPHVDAGDRRGVERVAGAFLGMVTAAFLVVSLLALAAGPLLLRLFALGVDDPAAAAAQRRVGMLLLVMTVPQVICYGVITTAIAVMNAHGRFTLAAAAPALENVGTMATLLATAVLYGAEGDVQNIPLGEVLLLGLGATAAVALHAGVQVWGVWRLGIRLVPRAGWREPEVRELTRRVVPSFWFTGLDTSRALVVLGVVNKLPGGVIAFQLATSLSYLVLALCATPVGAALLPQLSRFHFAGRLREFRDALVRGGGLVYFVVMPAVVAYLIFPDLLAGMVSFGEMATATAVALVAASIVAMAPGILGDASFQLAYQASYARQDARTPLLSQLSGTAASYAGILIAFLIPPGIAVLVVIGLAVSIGRLVSGWDLTRRLNRTLPKDGERAYPAILRAVGAAVLAAGPAYAAAAAVGTFLQGRAGQLTQLAVAGVVLIVIYVGVQRMWRSPELRSLMTAFGR